MPPLARYHIKTGLVYFAAALLLGVLLAAQPVFALPPQIAALRPVFLHLLIVGWVTQLIMGVVYWMFPKESKERPRGSPRLGWAVFLLLNGGLALRVIGEPLLIFQPGPAAGAALAVSAVLQTAAGWGFIANTWARIKER
ncbi:MAG: cbb3-type cytochrome c oxidase subunit I [Anaerolineae bacterium]|nr:cbb3-type cytochrome c oxidase subunit I [Anaerolineae bacterium]NUQ07182.1 cbb3-type cytochrome c oxidase subunit I [Anaerolineae bacterium]